MLVAGGSRGIGKGIAAAFAAEGAQVVITGRDRRSRRAAPPASAGRRGRGRQHMSRLRRRPARGLARRWWPATIERNGGLDVALLQRRGVPLGQLWRR